MPVMDAHEESIQPQESFNPQKALRRWVSCYTPADIFQQLTEKVWGQDQALMQATILVYSFLKNASLGHFDTKFHFMIEGQSGCGKSTFAQALQNIVPIPVIHLDSTEFTPNGWKGNQICDALKSDELDKWYHCCIVILDELDKKFVEVLNSSGDNFNRASLECFLRMLDGGMILDKDGDAIQCEKMLVIGMGAFTPARQQQTAKPVHKIGFGEAEPSTALQVSEKAEITKQVMSKQCGSEQFMGRFLTVLHFKPVSREIFKRIARNTIREIRCLYGCSAFLISDAEVDEMIDTAMQSEFGCREIRSAVWEKFLLHQNVISTDDLEMMEFEAESTERLLSELERMQNYSA